MGIETKNILVFPGGTEVGLEIWNSLKDCKEVELFSAGSPVSNHAPYVFKNHSIIPDIYHEEWIEELNYVLKKYDIDCIFPAYDDVLLALSQNSSKINAKIITSPPRTCKITRSKSKTYELFRNILPVPQTFDNISDITEFPVFVKPDKGQGSQFAEIVNNPYSLKCMLKKNSDLIISEYLPGKEYTVDCFSHRKEGLLFCGGRERIRTRNGISMNSKPVKFKLNKIFTEYALSITNLLELHGAWFFQIKQESKGNYKLLEIAPRISGTMATNRVMGVNFPLLSIYEREGYKVDIMTNINHVEIDRALINRYKHDINYNKVYVDLDDTLIIKNKINTQIMKFLYQAVNEGCQIILISKTVNNIRSYLKKWKLECLFDEIMILNKDDSKSDYIKPKNAIFIDDSFRERKTVFLRHKIPTFDSSMIEILIDDKI
ncbi:MAG: ATP-grasp domain-containing protein [Methanobacterium sp.]|nr:ATP-grasp domain-containing protein [Methanobacterium sp.]